MRAAAVALACAFAACAHAASFGTEARPVDLNAPGALEKLRAQDPRHYGKVMGMLRLFERIPCKPREVSSLEARYDIAEAACNLQLLTSFPPKRHVTFGVDRRFYQADVVVKDTGGKLVPATR
ncbi:MAG TPA: hypothetical protein VEG27_02640 [Usitatibacter sp.]|nr:hypothetical protein [Usitatibacter sp.]